MISSVQAVLPPHRLCLALPCLALLSSALKHARAIKGVGVPDGSHKVLE